MSGFLEHLVRRSLSDRVDVRPRPVSIFEPAQPSPAPDISPASLDMEWVRAADAGRRSDPPPVFPADGETRHPAPPPTNAPPMVVGSLQHRHVRLEPRGDAPRDMLPTPPAPEPQRDAAPIVAAPETTPVRNTTHMPAPRVEKRAGPPCATEPHDAPAKQASAVRAEPAARRGETLISALTELDPDPPPTLPTHRVRVQGRSAAPVDPENVMPYAETPGTAHRSIATQTTRHPSSEQPAPAAPQQRAIPAHPDPARSGSREATVAPAQATLAPRLAQPPPIPRTNAHPAQESASKPAEPIVHVTIGRVEIRAVPAPAAPKRAAPPKPALSLGDYLHRRNGGRG